MNDFEVLPDSDRPTTNYRPTSQISLKLSEGKTLFLPGKDHTYMASLRNPTGYLAARGFKVHASKTVRDGVAGIIVWAEK